VELLMRRAGLQGVTGRPKFRRGLWPEATASDLVSSLGMLSPIEFETRQPPTVA
jgi:hypothetical protein